MRTGTFVCTRTTAGRSKLTMHDVAGFWTVLDAYSEGEDFLVTIEEMGAKHTRAQEKFFHGPVLKAFMKLGMGKQEAKDMLCLMFIPRDVHMLDGSVIRVPGSTKQLGNIRVPGSTKQLGKEDYSELIERSIQCAAEQGEIVEDADEWRRQQAAA